MIRYFSDAFSKGMIAPCGLDCSVCMARFWDKPICPGCWSQEEGKPEHCSKLCKIALCEHRKSTPDGFCDKCKFYPCDLIIQTEKRYQTQYPLKASPMDNLSKMRQLGIEELLKRESKKWQCPKCDGIICVHTGKCNKCDYTV